MGTNAHWTGEASVASIAFGPFRLFPRQRLLTENGEPVRIGSRAYDWLRKSSSSREFGRTRSSNPPILRCRLRDYGAHSAIEWAKLVM
jgi:hypothetical protein